MALAKKKKAVKPPEKVTFMPCEWVIQFDNDEPQVFATADENVTTPKLTIEIQNTSESHITFVDSASNKSFKIYAREKK
jgi:hypothetical protein